MRCVPCRARRLALAVTAAAMFTTASPALAAPGGAKPPDVPDLAWSSCENGFECATMKVPRDYDERNGKTLDIAVTRRPADNTAERRGVLFFNFGGPGFGAVTSLVLSPVEWWAPLTEYFDLVGLDPRGTGRNPQTIDCKANQYTEGIYSQPFATPENIDERVFSTKVGAYTQRCKDLNADILKYASTANVARDMDLFRRALGEEKLNYFGRQYGTFLGATYATLFPHNYRAMMLDGLIDPDAYINRPLDALAAQSQAFERALGRFFQACAAQQERCGFGGEDPWDAFDEMVERANVTPIPAGAADPVDGDDLVVLAVYELFDRIYWPELAQALREAAAGDASLARDLVDGSYGLRPDGSFGPFTDRYFTLGAAEQNYPSKAELYFGAGRASWSVADHFWWNNGYVELNWAELPVDARDVFTGPFRLPADAGTPLLINITNNPANPYRDGKSLARQLGNARMLTMRGDAALAWPMGSSCVDEKVAAYFVDLVLPAPGTSCRQDAPAFPAQTLAAGRKQALRAQVTRPPELRAAALSDKR